MVELADKTFVVTGASSGIGLVTARELARRGARVILATRSRAKTDPVIAEITRQTGNSAVEVVELDLGDLARVRRSAEALAERAGPIHGLINNAGIAGMRGATKDGFELAFGTNHLGHYLFTRLLLPKLRASAPARIVNVASGSHYQAKSIDWAALQQPTKSITGLPEYAVSKLANVLFAKELANQLEGTSVTTYSLHPGTVATDVWRRVPAPIAWLAKRFMLTVEQGAVSTLRCATAPELASESGRYYTADGQEKRPSRLAQDPALARELWVKSAEWVGLPA
jgi:dehydrogenase/reductase SDR family protein 13